MSPIEDKTNMSLLEQFAAATKTKVIFSLDDIHPNDGQLEAMAGWCLKSGGVAVLKSASILTSDPTSANVQNCKKEMLARGIFPGQIYSTVGTVIKAVLKEKEESVKKIEQEKRAQEEAKQRAEEEKRREEQRIMDEAKKAEEAKKREEQRIKEEARKEEQRIMDEAKKAEEAKKREEQRIKEEARKEEQRTLNEAKKAEEASKREEQRIKDETRKEEQRTLNEAKKAEEASKKEELRIKDEAKKAESAPTSQYVRPAPYTPHTSTAGRRAVRVDARGAANKVRVMDEVSASFSEQQHKLRDLVMEAVMQDVSDIHIQVRTTYTHIRMRQHGELRLFAEWSEKLGREIASVAFNKETDHATSHFNPLTPQDASMPLLINGRDIRLRLASVPAHGGFDMVMRILATGEEKTKTLKDLGYTDEQIKIIDMAMELPFGAIIVAGPTGSGKTTTLASCMEKVSSDEKLYSIEDPVEKVVEAATQVPVNTEKADRSFAFMGRAALRMDPDVIILGEMRDEDTAQVMIRASITGHLVLSTLHTNRATAIITRLVDMGISPTLLSDSSVLRCLMCQRLISTVCQNCAISVRSSPDHQTSIPAWEAVLGKEVINNAKARGSGCNQCRNTGVSGRLVVAEVIWVDEEGRQFIQKCDTLGWEKYLKANGWQDFYARAVQLVGEGLCDPFEAEKVVGPISPETQKTAYRYSGQGGSS